MKKINFAKFICVLCFSLIFTSCQKEESELIDETDEETISYNSELARMLISASQNNGSVDDIIDGSSCVSVVFPLMIYANNQLLDIQNKDDLSLIQAVFDQYPNDTDSVEIVFPIKIQYEDYLEVAVEDQSAMNSIVASCQNFIDDTYSCVDFGYPITCFIYDSLNEQTGSVTLNNNAEWFTYLEYLTENILIAIDYGMTVIVDGESFLIQNNQELAAVFLQVDCNVDPGGGVDPDIEALRTIMKTGTWYVAQFLDDGEDKTADYSGYNFTFSDSVSVYATNGTEHVYGFWAVTLQQDQLNLEFDMDSPVNGADDDEYKVVEYTNESITFVTKNSNGTIEDTLRINKN